MSEPLATPGDVTPDLVRGWLHDLSSLADDPKAAHSLEDRIRGTVLVAIAYHTCTDPIECARLALTTADVEFSRWYA